jgi:succinyl-CoA synthetase beta subunit
MNLHEYQTKELLSKVGLPRLRSVLARTADEAARAFAELGGAVAAVKAQIHAGGRGKGGGVKLVRTAAEARAAAEAIFARPLVTPQTGPEGRTVRRVLVEAGCAIEREYYAGITLDRKAGAPSLLMSREGGVEIEVTAARNPDAIQREPIDPVAGLLPYQTRKICERMEWTGDTAKSGGRILTALAKAYLDLDASLLEINPLVLTKAGEFVLLDAKLNIDDRAVELKPDLEELRDEQEEDPRELDAHRHGLSYVSMDGNIGCLVNGAGLAMATMDIIQLAGGRPANFLDVGGGANREQVTHAFKLILSNPAIKAILINIFGGILRCDVLAEGVVAAAREIQLKVPLVVRLEGTNVEKGRAILKASGLAMQVAEDMADAARKVVAAAR